MSIIIPAHAKKVFSGIRFEIFQWEQELYDGSKTTFERARFHDGAFVIPILPDGTILLTRQEQPARDGVFYSLPGGGFDTPDEDPLVCAQRELWEETGYMSDDWELFRKEEGNANIIVYTYFYIARNCYLHSNHKNPDHGERVQLLPISFDAFLDIALDTSFIHWTLIPILCKAKLDTEYYDTLKHQLFYGQNS